METIKKENVKVHSQYNIAKRMRNLREDILGLGLTIVTRKNLALFLGCSTHDITNCEIYGTLPNMTLLHQLHLKCHVDVHWVLFGEGEPIQLSRDERLALLERINNPKHGKES